MPVTWVAYGRDRRGSELRTTQRFTSQLTDGTGLVYMNARYYDPQLGQFISPDTLVPDATQLMDFNRYAYARGTPMKYNDPSGHCPGGVVNPNRFMQSPCESVGPATKVEAELATADENAAALTQAETIAAPEAPAPSTPLENAVSANDGADAPPAAEIGSSQTSDTVELENSVTGNSSTTVAPTNAVPTVYRGGSSLTARPSDVRIDKASGLLRPGWGISLNSDPNASQIVKYGGPYKVDSIPDGLQITQVGKEGHFELAPARSMTMEQYQGLLQQVQLSPVNK